MMINYRVTTRRIFFLAPVFFSLLLFSSIGCKKSTTPPAPSANPNMYYSNWTAATWTGMVFTDEYNEQDTGYTFKINASKVTQTILDSGTVLVYIKFASRQGTVYTLPYVDPYSALTWWFENSPGILNVNYAFGPALGGLDPGPYNNNEISVRYIILTGGQPSGNSVQQHGTVGENRMIVPDVKNQPTNIYQQMSYEQVCKMFNIPE